MTIASRLGGGRKEESDIRAVRAATGISVVRQRAAIFSRRSGDSDSTLLDAGREVRLK